MATMQRLPNTPETQAVRDEIQAYLTAAMAQTVEIVNQARAPSISVAIWISPVAVVIVAIVAVVPAVIVPTAVVILATIMAIVVARATLVEWL